jgi:phospholipid/cholesterol/gamma-HCH transport system substrate-binding protein
LMGLIMPKELLKNYQSHLIVKYKPFLNKNKMEKTSGQKIQLGLFVIIGLFVFVIAIYFIGDKQKMFGKTYHLHSVFNNVNGLQLGNNVRYSGVNVGTVRSIEMINDTTINVDMIIDKGNFNFIKKNAIAIIGSDGLVGNKIINILPGKGDFPSVQAGDQIKSINKVNTDDMLNTLDVTNKNASQLTLDLLKITKQINAGKGTIGVLIKDSIVANEIKSTISNLNQTSKGTNQLIHRANQMVNELNQKNNLIGVLKDTLTGAKIKNIITNIDQLSAKMNVITQNLDKTIVNIKDGKGALNYLSNDPNLVRKIDSTMTNINGASFRLNENLEALKHNFLFRSYYKNQEKEKIKAQKNISKEVDKKY